MAVACSLEVGVVVVGAELAGFAAARERVGGSH
jgi:monoamine oxidase